MSLKVIPILNSRSIFPISPARHFSIYSSSHCWYKRLPNTPTTGKFAKMNSSIFYFLLAVLVTTSIAQQDSAFYDCIHKYCCQSVNNQDTSQACWDNCKSFQGSLAGIGCHILDPSTLEPTTTIHLPDPTV
jgi:hypothetical protein